MARSNQRLPINPSVLKWARQNAGFSVEEIAEKTSVNRDKVMSWEAGEASPTLRQARNLAKYFKRPFLEFFATEIPEISGTQLVPDFRFHPTPIFPDEERELKEVQAWAEEQRLNVLDLMEMLGETPGQFPEELHATTSENVEQIAQQVRAFVDFPIEEQIQVPNSKKSQIPKTIRAKFSACNTLVLKESRLSKIRTRGICLFAEPLPIIIYGNEAPGAQAFTLAHEFAHIILKKSAISAFLNFDEAKDTNKAIESWCNKFAAAFLMPADAVEKNLDLTDIPAPSISDNEVSRLATTFGVSRHAMLIRLVSLQYVDPQYYWRVKREQYINEAKNYTSPPVRSPYYGKRYKNRLGEFYTGLVIEAWNIGKISAHNAAEFMGIKNIQHLNDIRNEV